MFSLFLLSAADNSKDLATELVHYGFIHEVSLLAIPCHLSCACTVLQQQSPNPCGTSCFRGVGAPPFPAWQPGAVTMPSLQLHAVLIPFAVSDTFFFFSLHTLPVLLGLKGQLYCVGRVTTLITSTLHWFWMWKPEWRERKSRPPPISQRNCSSSLCCSDSCSYVTLQISACQKWPTPTLHFQALPWCLQTVPSENAELPCHSDSIIASRKDSMERIKNISIFILYKLGILGL